MSIKYLDSSGLAYLWGKIKSAFLSNSGGQITGDLSLYSASGNSPSLIFQRGTIGDSQNDWKIYGKGGALYFAEATSGSATFTDKLYIGSSGQIHGSLSWSDVTDKPPELPAVTASDNGKVLRVVSGDWSAVELPSASGVSF